MGGALCSFNDGATGRLSHRAVYISYCDFTENGYTAQDAEESDENSGGAVFLRTSGVGLVVNLIQSNFTENSANLGGAVTVSAAQMLKSSLCYIDSCMFRSNSADKMGGAILVAGDFNLILEATTLKANRAVTGAGLWLGLGTGLIIPEWNLQTSFEENTAVASGGGIACDECRRSSSSAMRCPDLLV